MANKKYVNDSMQNSTFQVNSHKPMDDRLVIRLRENLMQSETWQLTSNGDVMLYSGIIVNVIDDTDAHNGLYSLKNWTKYDKQSWDSSDAQTYDADGWKKVVGDSSDAVQSDWNQTDTTALDYIKNKPQFVRVLDDLEDVEITPVDFSQQTYFEDAVEDYDGNLYDAVIIGDQVWMAENYRSTHYNNGIAINTGEIDPYSTNGYSEYPNNDSNNVDDYGLLYTYYAYIDENFAPSGWHVPSRNECDSLVHSLFLTYGNSYVKQMASTYGWTYSGTADTPGNNQNTNNSSLFNLPPAGNSISNTFGNIGLIATTNTENNVQHTEKLDYNVSNATYTQYAKWAAVSVRFICDFTADEFRAKMGERAMKDQHLIYDGELWRNQEVEGSLDKVHWCYWDDNNSTVTGLTPAQIYQLTQDGCIVKCMYSESESYIFDLTRCAKFGDTYEIEFIMPIDITSSSVSHDRISGHIDGTWEYISAQFTEHQSDWNQSNINAADYIKNKPTFPTVRTMNHEQLTDSSLGDINIHDGYYFPNAVQDYDGNWYGAVVIGDQVWLAENLRTTHFYDGTPITEAITEYSTTEPYYYHANNNANNDEIYGLLYNFTAVKGTFLDNTWHVPSYFEDFGSNGLIGYINKQQRYKIGTAGYNKTAKSLASNNNWVTNSQPCYIGIEPEKNNATGFNAQPAGNFSQYGNQSVPQYNSFNSRAVFAGIVSSTQQPGIMTLQVGTNDVLLEYGSSQSLFEGRSVRCVSDLTPIQFRNWYVETYGTMQHHLLPTYTYYSHTCTNASEPLLISCPDNEITHHDIGIDPNLSTAPSITINLCNTNDNCFTFIQGFTPSYYPVTLQYKGTAINHVVNFGGNSMGIFKDTNDDLYLYTKGRSMVFKLRVVTASTPYVLIESGEIDSTILNSNS